MANRVGATGRSANSAIARGSATEYASSRAAAPRRDSGSAWMRQ